MKYLLISVFSMLLAVNHAFAGNASEQDIKDLRAALIKNMPQAADGAIKATPVKGLYEVTTGPQILYMTKDARFVLDGDMYDLQSRQNLTEETRGLARKATLDDVNEDSLLVYTPKGEVKHTITVFTDIYCPYCRRLHQEMSEYMEGGVKVRYVFVPFKGKRSYDTSVSVWCADNPQQAMDKAKAGEDVAAKTCDHPIEQHTKLAQALGVRGTPAIMYENGQMNPGYAPAKNIIQQLESMGL